MNQHLGLRNRSMRVLDRANLPQQNRVRRRFGRETVETVALAPELRADRAYRDLTVTWSARSAARVLLRSREYGTAGLHLSQRGFGTAGRGATIGLALLVPAAIYSAAFVGLGATTTKRAESVGLHFDRVVHRRRLRPAVATEPSSSGPGGVAAKSVRHPGLGRPSVDRLRRYIQCLHGSVRAEAERSSLAEAI